VARAAVQAAAEAKLKKKADLMKALKAGSKCGQLGAQFLSSLGDQKVTIEIQAAKMDERKERAKIAPGGQVKMKGVSRTASQKGSVNQDKTNEGALTSGPASKADIVLGEGEVDGDAGVEDDADYFDAGGLEQDSRFVNPFAAAQQKPGLDLEELEAHLKPKLDALWAAVDENRELLSLELQDLQDKEALDIAKCQTTAQQNFLALSKSLQEPVGEIASLKAGASRFEEGLRFDIKQVEE
jgi:hypothetical protein